jgi:hypothetical protein
MAWTTPLTAVANAALTAAQWNASVRDNLLLTPAALASADSQWFVSTGANAVVARRPDFGNTVSTSQTTTSTSFVDLTTVGPTLTATTGVRGLILWGCQLTNSGAAAFSYMSFTGANFTASATAAVQSTGTAAIQACYSLFLNGMTAGSNTFTAKYAVTSGTGTFQDRRLQLLPF